MSRRSVPSRFYMIVRQYYTCHTSTPQATLSLAHARPTTTATFRAAQAPPPHPRALAGVRTRTVPRVQPLSPRPPRATRAAPRGGTGSDREMPKPALPRLLGQPSQHEVRELHAPHRDRHLQRLTLRLHLPGLEQVPERIDGPGADPDLQQPARVPRSMCDRSRQLTPHSQFVRTLRPDQPRLSFKSFAAAAAAAAARRSRGHGTTLAPVLRNLRHGS
jgi:hypothetical protein